MSSIKLSPKHGLNPSVMLCFLCGEPSGVAIPGQLRPERNKAGEITNSDPEAPREAVWDYEPCSKCSDLMTQGVMLIEVDESKTTDKNNPYRTGSMCVIKDDALSRIMKDGDLRDTVLRRRAAFIPTEVWDAIGLPRENVPQQS